MVSLLQLNQHLDDVHNQADRDPTLIIKDWFKKTSRNFNQAAQQATSTFGQLRLDKLNLDRVLSNATLESNYYMDAPSTEQSSDRAAQSFDGVKERVLRRTESQVNYSSPMQAQNSDVSPAIQLVVNQAKHKRVLSGDKGFESLVTKSHWQRETGNDLCSIKSCRKALGIIYGKFNCFLCVYLSN